MKEVDDFEDDYSSDEDFDIGSNDFELDDEDFPEDEEKSPEDNIPESDKVDAPFSNLKKKNKKMYFDEELVDDLIRNKYQPFLDYEINEKGKRVCVSRERASKEVEREIMENLFLIANAIINKYRYWRFDLMEDLQAEALRAMWKYLPNYEPSKGTAFNLFSIICKRHLYNYTYKSYNYRLASNIDEVYDISSPKEFKYNLFFEDLEKVLLNVVNEYYNGEKRKKMLELTSIFMEYVTSNLKILGKSDILSAFKQYSYKSSDYRMYIDELKKHKEEIISAFQR